MKSFNSAFKFGLIFYVGIIFLGDFHAVNPDGVFRLDMTRSLLTEGSFATAHGPINYAPLQSILMIPSYALGYFYGSWVHAPPEKQHLFGILSTYFLFLPVVLSALCIWFFKILKEMGVDNQVSIISTVILFWGTYLLPYGKGMFSEPLSALLILISFYYFLVSQSGNYLSSNRKNFFCLSLLVLNNFVFLLYFGLMMVYVFWGSRIKRRDPSETRRVVLEGLFFLGASVFLFLCYNYFRYGQFFNFGYSGEGFSGNLIVGLYGLLFSVGRGLVIYSPITILCLLFFTFRYHEMELWRQFVFSSILVSFLCFLLVYSKWDYWYGGICWGPRFLIPFIPLIHLMFPMVWKSMSASSKPVRVGVFLIIFWGIGMNLWQHLNPDLIYQKNDLMVNGLYNPEYLLFSDKLDFLFVLNQAGLFLGLLVLSASLLWVWNKPPDRLKSSA